MKSVVLQTNCRLFSALNVCRAHTFIVWMNFTLGWTYFTAISHSEYYCIAFFVDFFFFFFSRTWKELRVVFFSLSLHKTFILIKTHTHSYIYPSEKIYAEARTIPTISLSTSVEYTIWKIDMRIYKLNIFCVRVRVCVWIAAWLSRHPRAIINIIIAVLLQEFVSPQWHFVNARQFPSGMTFSSESQMKCDRNAERRWLYMQTDLTQSIRRPINANALIVFSNFGSVLTSFRAHSNVYQFLSTELRVEQCKAVENMTWKTSTFFVIAMKLYQWHFLRLYLFCRRVFVHFLCISLLIRFISMRIALPKLLNKCALIF